MTKTKAGMAAALLFGAASLLFSASADAMPIDRLATATPIISDGIQNVRWVCGPYRCWWRPNYYAYAPFFYYGPPRFWGPRRFHRFGYHRRWRW